MTPIRKIGIIGAGQMGSGIAHVVALHGYDVAMHDMAKEKVEAAIETIDKNLARQVASGKISEDEKQKALARITYAETHGGLRRRRSRHRGGDRGRDGEAQDLRGALSLSSSPTPSSPPTPRRSRSRGLPPPPTGPSASSACIS